MKVKQRRPDLVKAIQEGGRGPMPMPMPSWASRGEFRKHKASWRASFKSEWKILGSRNIDSDRLKMYHTDPLSEPFLHKHIVHCYEPIENSFRYFETVADKELFHSG
jgi:hypothetical protein